jgi:serine phosphatase RsbU (regulator of sigma subunit)
VQQSLMPRRPPLIEGFDIAGGCLPASQVGGDFFDWFVVGEELQVTIADVMGKGIGSAIIAAAVRAVLRSTSRASRRANDRDDVARPVVAHAVGAAARGLEPDLEETGTFVTMFTARLSPHNPDLRYVDAGHGLTVLIRHGGGVQLLPTTDLPIGVMSQLPWTEHRVTLGEGDTVISVSDGILDFFGSAADVLDAAETVVRGTDTAQQTVDEIIRFARARRIHDDVTALVIRRTIS